MLINIQSFDSYFQIVIQILSSSFGNILIILAPIMTEILPSEQKPIPQLLETPELILMKSKLPQLKNKMDDKFPLCFELLPNDPIKYEQRCKNLIQKISVPAETYEVDEFEDIILGALEGTTSAYDEWRCLNNRLKIGDKDLWNSILKNPQKKLTDKFSKRNYGNSKNKNTYSIWEVKDINILQETFDISALKEHRKICKQFGSYYRAMTKFVEKLQKMLNGESLSQEGIKELFEDYKKIDSEENKYIKLKNKNSNDKNVKMVQMPEISEEKKEAKDDSKQQQDKDKQNKQKQVKLKNAGKNKSKAKKKEETPADQIKKQLEEMNKDGEDIKEVEENNSSNKAEKKKEKKQQNSSQKRPSQAQLNKQNMQKKYGSLDLFFKKKVQVKQKEKEEEAVDPENIEKEEKSEAMEIQKNSTDLFLESIQGNSERQIISVEDLRNKFKGSAPEKTSINLHCYVNIVVCKSRLEYYDYLITEPKIQFTDPLRDVDNVRYEDSSDEYSELVADSINQEMVQEDDEQEEEQSNSAIVPDSYCEYKSNHVFSSDEESSETPERELKPQIVRGNKWHFFRKMKEDVATYSLFGNEMNREPESYNMIYVGEESMPLPLKDLAQENNGDEITPQMKIDMYKQIHGSYTSKQSLVKKINLLVDNKISMNKLNLLLKDITEKKGTQRILKPEIIRQFTEQCNQIAPNFQNELEELRKERQTQKNQQMEAKREERNIEKEQKLEKLILDYTGNITIKDIVEYLKNNDLKIIKSQLSNFIKSHEGEQWEVLREQIKKNKLTRGRKPKKGVEDMEEQEKNKLKNAHRNIQDILKQNQIDFANRPKKIRPSVEDQRMISAEEYEKLLQEQQKMEGEYEDMEDESYDVKNKNKNKNKNKKKKISKIPVIQCSIPGGAVRRNPRRNKHKSIKNKKSENEEEVKQELQKKPGENQMEEEDIEVPKQKGEIVENGMQEELIMMQEKGEEKELVMENQVLARQGVEVEEDREGNKQVIEKTANKKEFQNCEQSIDG